MKQYKESFVFCLHNKVLVAVGGGYRCGLSEKSLGATPYQRQPGPANSKRNPPLAKAESIRNSCVTSVITYLRKGKEHCAAAVREINKRTKLVGSTHVGKVPEGMPPNTGAGESLRKDWQRQRFMN